MSSTPREENRVPGLVAKSDSDNTPVIVEADPTTKRLKTNATITGTIEDALASTGTVTSVADTNSNTTLLSANTDRFGFRLYNDSTITAYVKYGTTASSTDFTVKLFPETFHYEDNYYGRVDCIWASNGSGSMRVTELT